jgi:DNA repair protein RadD
MKELFPDQDKALIETRALVAKGKRRIMLNAPTSWGKTIYMAEVIRRCQIRGLGAWVVVDAISLIDQTVQKLYAQGVYSIAVLQSNHPMEDYGKKIQVCSVQTLCRRKLPPTPYVMFIDEAHCQSKWLMDLIDSPEWQDVLVIGLSATPGSKGLGLHYHDMIVPITLREMIEQGRCCGYEAFVPEYTKSLKPKLAKVKMTETAEWGKDYAPGELSKVMQDEKLVGDILTHWKLRLVGRPTIGFCVDRAHAQKVQGRFEAKGVNFGYIDAFTEVQDRNIIQKRVESGDLAGVISVGTMIKGVDWILAGMIDAQPTKSTMRQKQKAGRTLRLDQYGDAIWNDHAGNLLELGCPEDIFHHKMDMGCKTEREAKAVEAEPAKPKECPKCNAVKKPGVKECPSCGFAPSPMSYIEEAPGELIPIKKGKSKPTAEDQARFHAELTWYAQQKGKAPGYPTAIYKARYGSFPEQRYVNPIPASPETLSYIRSRNIAYNRGKAAHG